MQFLIHQVHRHFPASYMINLFELAPLSYNAYLLNATVIWHYYGGVANLQERYQKQYFKLQTCLHNLCSL